MSNELVARLRKRAKDVSEWVANSQRVVELMQPEWDRFEARDGHNVYASTLYAEHFSSIRTQTKELADWTDAADEIERLTAQLAETRESERAAVVAWLRDDAAKTADDLRRLHAKKKLTPMMTEGWEAVIRTKGGVAFAIEAGEHLA